MSLKRSGNAILNTDNEAYMAAKKRLASQKERKKKDRLLESLNEEVQRMKEELKVLYNLIEEIKNDISGLQR
jgi:hypothetical protein